MSFIALFFFSIHKHKLLVLQKFSIFYSIMFAKISVYRTVNSPRKICGNSQKIDSHCGMVNKKRLFFSASSIIHIYRPYIIIERTHKKIRPLHNDNGFEAYAKNCNNNNNINRIIFMFVGLPEMSNYYAVTLCWVFLVQYLIKVVLTLKKYALKLYGFVYFERSHTNVCHNCATIFDHSLILHWMVIIRKNLSSH